MINCARLVGLISVCLCVSTLNAAEPTASDIKQKINRAMQYIKHEYREGGPQYSDYVVFCGLSVEKEFPEYREIIDRYRKKIIQNDKFSRDSLYHSACHVMALDLIGQKEKALEIFSELRPFANDGQWPVPYHIGWYLYGCIVAGDNELLDKTFNHLSKTVGTSPGKYQYFTAYCLLKAYDRTKDERYNRLFLSIVGKLKDFREEYFKMAANDGHMGMTLYTFCVAFRMTQDEEYRQISKKLAGILMASQEKTGSWNDCTAYTIMPVEGLTAYLKYCVTNL